MKLTEFDRNFGIWGKVPKHLCSLSKYRCNFEENLGFRTYLEGSGTYVAGVVIFDKDFD